MANKRPTDADLIAGHIIVGLLASYVGRQIQGFPGAIALGALSVIAHRQLDAPVARGIANLT